MRSWTAILLLTVCFSAAVAHATPAHLWSHHYGDATDESVNSVFFDKSGNVVLVGGFRGAININTPYTTIGSRDGIVAKFAPNGTPLWSYRIGYPFADTAWDACADVSGNTIVGGSTGPLEEERRAFLARLTPAGAEQWAKHFSPGDNFNAYVMLVAVDQQKQIYAAGTFQNEINFGGSTLVAVAFEDMFLAKFTALGEHVWSKRFGSAGFGVVPIGLEVAADGNPVLFGEFDGNIHLGGTLLTSAGQGDTFLAKFNGADGAHLWSKKFGGVGSDVAAGMDIDAAGRIALTGEMGNDFSFGGPVLDSHGGPDAFLALLEADGDHIWSKVYGEGDREGGYSVAFASNGDVLMTVSGNGTDPFTLGGGPLSGQGSYYDLYVARYFVADGAHRWSTRIYTTDGSVFAFADERMGKLVMCGSYYLEPLDLGAGPMANAGENDIFIAMFVDHLTGAGPSLARAELLQNSPNPFNPTTRIEYSLVSPAHATIEIFNASGAVVARLDEGRRPAGVHSAVWNGRDTGGRAVASGVYFYRLAGMPEVGARKMVLLK